MPAITIQQAYALANKAFVSFDDSLEKPVFSGYVSVPGLDSVTTKNRLSYLLDSVNKDLGAITYVFEGATITMFADANTPSNTTYTLVTSTQDLNSNSIEDHKEGGSINAADTVLSPNEAWLHFTGGIILRKLKK